MSDTATVAMSETADLKWQPAVTLFLSLIGLVGSIYLTISHFDTHISLVCPDLGPCNKILTSNTSHFLGIPVPVLGLLYFVPMTVLCLPALWRTADKRVHWVRLILSVLGAGMIIYLFIEELFVLQALCLWCSIIHLVGFLLFVIIAISTPGLLGAGSASASPER